MNTQQDYDKAYEIACETAEKRYPRVCGATIELLGHAMVWCFDHGVPPASLDALGTLINALFEAHGTDPRDPDDDALDGPTDDDTTH